MPVVHSEHLDPYTNLAVESCLLDRAAHIGPTLILWSNEPCVVLGRHQNPWLECNLREMSRHDVKLVRRISGGGTVYHDPGNINFCFLLSDAQYDQERQFSVVLRALRELGIPAVKNERNDLCVGSRKFSGNAFRHSKGNSLHHGTLLLNADIEALTRYLAPPELGIETKAIASVRSQVINLEESVPGLDRSELIAAFIREFHREYEPDRPGLVSGTPAAREAPSWWPARSEIEARVAELSSWEWVFGHTPSFSRRYTHGKQIAEVVVKRGVIQSIVSEGNAAEGIADATTPFVGVPLRGDAIRRVDCERSVLWLQQALLVDL
ncbi:MAG: biotin/lipoate A/B protein ligase family protein [Spirochaetales bacterium]